jgi:hypothetical protein
MLNQQTIEKLHAMRMRGMADAFIRQQEEPQTSQLSFEERFAMLVDRQWNWRQNRALERRLKEGRLQGPACFEDIDFRAARGLDKVVPGDRTGPGRRQLHEKASGIGAG